MRVLSAVALVAMSGAIVACGSSNKGALTPNTSSVGSTNPQDANAGTVTSISAAPGTIIADNGFRPKPNGFSFVNYGDQLVVDNTPIGAPNNLTPAELQNIFGSQVCSSGSGSSCELSPPAKAWLQEENQGMNGGHCFGFSVTALRIYSGNTKPSDLGGASDTYGLPLKDNPQVQTTIAQNFVGQSVPLEQDAIVKGTPNDVLNKLVQALKDKSEYYTIGFFKRDGGGGHAVTPYAVVEKGGGKRGVLIYDNNFPGVTREIEWDTDANTWSYDGGPNPSDLSEHYEGDAKTQSLQLMPVKPIEQRQPCPFCNGESVGGAANRTGSVLGAAQQYNEITLLGNPGNHAHVVLTDNQGNQSGFINGQDVNDIPGVKIVQNFADQTWAEAPEPQYDVPVKADVKVTIDGSDLKREDAETIDLVGPGDYNEVQDIKLIPGEKDTIDFTGDGTGYLYQTAQNQNESPIIASGVEGKTADYGFVVKALNTRGGSSIDTQLDHQTEQLDFDTTGSGPADYVVAVVRQDESGQATWSTQNMQNGSLHLEDGDKVHIDYGQSAKGQPLKVTINKKDGSTQTVELPA
jgi:hypothetical protein